MLKRLMLLSLLVVSATAVGCATTPHSRMANYDASVAFNPLDGDWATDDLFEKNAVNENVLVKVFTHRPSDTIVTGEYFPNRLAEPELMALADADAFQQQGYRTTPVVKILGERGASYTFQYVDRDATNSFHLPVTVVYARPYHKSTGLVRYQFLKGPSGFDPTPLLVTE